MYQPYWGGGRTSVDKEDVSEEEGQEIVREEPQGQEG
jgi:hypothetical protein